jgi:hypothetical protein
MTTQWQSMFDGGACTVSAQQGTHPNLWSGTLAKGDTSPVFTGFGGTPNLQIDVDASGAVTLRTDNEGTLYDMTLRVVPSYSVSDKQIQASDILVPNGVGGFVTNSEDVYDDSVDIAIGADGTATPDPVTFAVTGLSNEIAVYSGAPA